MTDSKLGFAWLRRGGERLRIALEGALLRAHSAAAAGALVLVLAGALLVPACSTTDEAGPGCSNGARDDGEEGIDCGGVCSVKCTGSGCTTGEECASGKCDGNVCGAPEGKPCGVGVPTKCNEGDKCELDRDCTTGFCDVGKCGVPSEASHTDGQKNGGETGIDCGGTVKAQKPCPDGQGCTGSTDCVGTCNAGTCGPIGPKDGKKNGDETDVDCGGSAPGCPNGKVCAVNGDCADKYCPAATKTCTAPSYTDGVLNGTETDVDCGGTGPGMKKCGAGLICLVDGDCNAACNYAKKCTDIPSCKPRMGGDTCGGGDLGAGQTETHETGAGSQPGHEDCCRTLEVKGYSDPGHVGKKVYVDKYEITAGRVRAFIEWLTAKYAGQPNMRIWVGANKPEVWDNAWNEFLPTGFGTDVQNMPHNPNPFPPYGPDVPPPWSQTVGTDWVFGSNLMVYAHGHDTFHKAGSYGFTTFWYPPAIMANPNNGVPRVNGHDGAGNLLVAKDELDKKSMTAIPNAILQAFCTWDGGQLATDEVLDFVTGSPATLANNQGCGNNNPALSRCAPLANVNATSDSGTSTPLNYNYPYYDNGGGGTETSEGVNRLGAPGRLPVDKVVINAGDEPWMDLHGNLQESVLDMTGATFTGKFGLKYRGIGYSSARALTNPTILTYPEYRAGYTGGRCMRIK